MIQYWQGIVLERMDLGFSCRKLFFLDRGSNVKWKINHMTEKKNHMTEKRNHMI